MMHLNPEERKTICNYLTERFLTVFRIEDYTNEEELQGDFRAFKVNLKQYHAVLDRLLKDNPLNRQLTWRDVRITAKRWHICKICNQPFISYNAFNKMKLCTRLDYVRYNTSTNQYYKSTGQSICYMQYRRQIAELHYKKLF